MPTRRDAPELKLIKGAEPRERDVTSPRPAQREPKPPGWLTPPQREVWDLVVVELRDMGQLFSADTQEIVNYVVVTNHAHRCAQDLNKLRIYTYDTVQGGVAAHPLVAVYDRLVARAHQLAKHLGLNPAGRSAIYGRSVRTNTEAERTELDLFG
jgi:P27 family predicted phage terminase small subunit